MRFGLMMLGDLVVDPHSGRTPTHAERHRSIVELGVRAEQLGFDSVWLGEHHFCDYIVSSPAVVLAAIAERTTTIRLGTSVSLVGNLDPVRVAEDYATLDVLSAGRVELAVGRGIADRVHEGFGQDPADSRDRMVEHLELLLHVWTERTADWSGTFRAPLRDLGVEPRPVQQPHPPVWVGGGSSPDSAALAARLGLGLLLPSVLAPPEAFAANVDRYRRQFRPAPGGPPAPVVGACSHVHVGPDTPTAQRRWEPYHMGYFDWLADVIAWGKSTPRTRRPADYAGMLSGPSVCGGPVEVAERLTEMHRSVGLDLHLAMFDHGGMPHELVTETIETFAAEVIPRIAGEPSPAAAPLENSEQVQYGGGRRRRSRSGEGPVGEAAVQTGRTVMVTGATGFIGGHVLKALVDAGHSPRALVRDPAKLRTVRDLHGLGEIDHVVGDMTDAASVSRALDGADACIHTAAVTALKSSEADAIAANNVNGGRIVLDAAVGAGCDPVVHLSTVSAIFPPQGPVLTPDDPVTEPSGAYSASKAEIDRHARSLQDRGAPVVIVYPGGVVGPTDAGVNVIADGMSRMLNFGFLAFPQGGGNIWINVRDLAGALVAMLEPGRGPRRYMAGGHFVPWTEFIDMMLRLTSGEYTVERPSNDALKEMARQGEAAAAESGEDPPLDYESAAYMCDAVASDDSRLLDEFGLHWRPTETSWRDLLTWCAEQGLLAPERSEKLLPSGRGSS